MVIINPGGVAKMRLIARLPDERQVSALVDSLRNIGFNRRSDYKQPCRGEKV